MASMLMPHTLGAHGGEGGRLFSACMSVLLVSAYQSYSIGAMTINVSLWLAVFAESNLSSSLILHNTITQYCAV